MIFAQFSSSCVAMVRSQLSLLLVSLLVTVRSIEDQAYWFVKAGAELEDALGLKWNTGLARNVLLFVGDGMGPNTVTAARIYRAAENSSLAFENFPHVGLIKTYSADKQVPDSASTATAMFSGVKNNHETLGVDAEVRVDDCAKSLRPEYRLSTVAAWAQAAGKHTGLVTTARVTHATPAALYAHCANRRWECDSKMPESATGVCKDIARQLVEDEPGRNFQVVMGGGRQCLVTNTSVSEDDPRDTWACSRADGRDLVQEWAAHKRQRRLTHRYLSSTADLDSLDVGQVDYVLGLFANGHMRMDHERNRSPNGMPSLAQMTKAAIEVLLKNEKGFFLMVEGGMIDYAHHRGFARAALDETVALDEAIRTALESLRAHGQLNSTLVIVTSDHSHSLAINGNPPRGNNILGIAQKSKADGVPFTTLLYATGGKENWQYEAAPDGGGARRRDPSREDTTRFGYHQQAAVRSDEAHHDGGDVAVYATGPQAHLFHSVHEQNYVAHVIAYAAKIGHHAVSQAPSSTHLSPVPIILVFISCLFFRLKLV